MGRKGANQTAVTLAGVGTLACGLSNSMEMLIVARFVRYHSILFPPTQYDPIMQTKIGGLGGGGIVTTAT
jgi:MFS family permease